MPDLESVEMKRNYAVDRDPPKPDGVQSVEARRRVLEEEMQRTILNLKESSFFRLDDFILPAAPSQAAQPHSDRTRAARASRPSELGPLYVSRPLAPQKTPSRTKPILTYRSTKRTCSENHPANPVDPVLNSP